MQKPNEYNGVRSPTEVTLCYLSLIIIPGKHDFSSPRRSCKDNICGSCCLSIIDPAVYSHRTLIICPTRDLALLSCLNNCNMNCIKILTNVIGVTSFSTLPNTDSITPGVRDGMILGTRQLFGNLPFLNIFK